MWSSPHKVATKGSEKTLAGRPGAALSTNLSRHSAAPHPTWFPFTGPIKAQPCPSAFAALRRDKLGGSPERFIREKQSRTGQKQAAACRAALALGRSHVPQAEAADPPLHQGDGAACKTPAGAQALARQDPQIGCRPVVTAPPASSSWRRPIGARISAASFPSPSFWGRRWPPERMARGSKGRMRGRIWLRSCSDNAGVGARSCPSPTAQRLPQKGGCAGRSPLPRKTGERGKKERGRAYLSAYGRRPGPDQAARMLAGSTREILIFAMIGQVRPAPG